YPRVGPRPALLPADGAAPRRRRPRRLHLAGGPRPGHHRAAPRGGAGGDAAALPGGTAGPQLGRRGHEAARPVPAPGRRPPGAQPMTDGAGNWVTFNGEIYNYVELRREIGLEHFRTHSDTEVILQAYRKWGEQCVEHLRGMFAFALWDEARQRLFCARDRFG